MDIKEVRDEIERLENEDTTYPNCSKLAILYSINDHHKNNDSCIKKTAEYSYGASEFLNVASRCPTEEVLDVINEHLEAVQFLYPKEYRAVINKIRERASI